MSGAGETRNSRIDLIGGDAAETCIPSQTKARLYWRNGITWTVYHGNPNRRARWRAILSEFALQIRRGRDYFLSAVKLRLRS